MYNPFDKSIKSVYGPYLRPYKRGPSRYQVVIVFDDDSKTSMSNSRWIMTQHLQRKLAKHEHIDHINEDPQDDRIDNLQILTPADNNRKTNVGKPSPFAGMEKGWRHGTLYGWQKKKCECDDCLTHKSVWQDQRNARRRKRR